MAPSELQLLGYRYSSMITNAGRHPNRAMGGEKLRALVNHHARPRLGADVRPQ